MPARTALTPTLCPLGRTAEFIGDRAVMLILREIFFKATRFDDLVQRTGLGPQLLSARLKMLEKEGVIARQAYQQKPPRYDYVLTAKGQDLFDILYAMRNWAEKWAYTDGEKGAPYAVAYVHATCGADVGTQSHCPQCGERLVYGSLKAKMSPPLLAERQARLAKS